MAPKTWWAWLNRQLATNNITVTEFKKNPYLAYRSNPAIRKWMHQSFNDDYSSKKPIKWFNNSLNLHEIFTDHEWHASGNFYILK